MANTKTIDPLDYKQVKDSGVLKSATPAAGGAGQAATLPNAKPGGAVAVNMVVNKDGIPTAGGNNAKLATLVSDAGDRVVVEVGSKDAQQRFAQGYRLDTGAPLPGNQDSARNAPPSTPNEVTNLDQARQFINANQDSVINAGTEVKTRDRGTSLTDTAATAAERVKSVTDSLGVGDRPQAPGLEQSYNDLRTQYQVGGLEDRLNDLTTRQDKLKADTKALVEAERAKTGVAQGVIENRVREIESGAQRELDQLIVETNSVTGQLNSKYGVISMLMGFKSQDYQNATGEYDAKYNQALQAYAIVKGEDAEAKTDAQRAQESARANLTVVMNALNESGASLTDAQRAEIRRMEMEAGYPEGFTEALRTSRPDADIVTTNNWTDASGREYVSVITRDKSGQLATENVLLGQGRVSASGAAAADKLTKEQLGDLQTTIENYALDYGQGVEPPSWAKPYLVAKYALVEQTDAAGNKVKVRQATGEYEAKKLTKGEIDRIGAAIEKEQLDAYEAAAASQKAKLSDVDEVMQAIGTDLSVNGMTAYESKRAALAAGVPESVYTAALRKYLDAVNG